MLKLYNTNMICQINYVFTSRYESSVHLTNLSLLNTAPTYSRSALDHFYFLRPYSSSPPPPSPAPTRTTSPDLRNKVWYPLPSAHNTLRYRPKKPGEYTSERSFPERSED